MAKKSGLKSVMGFIAWIVGLATSLAIGGSFVAGKFTDVMILSAVPVAAHAVIGWLIVLGALIGAVLALIEYVR